MNPIRMVTDRLELVAVDESHADLLYQLHRDARVMRYIRAPDTQPDQAREFIHSIRGYMAAHPGLGIFPAFRRDNRTFVGWAVLIHLEKNPANEIELGYRLTFDTWGQGYATEMGRALLQHARTALKLRRVVAITHPENLASQNVLHKLGFRFERNAVFYANDVKYFGNDLT